jgi:hypothetical protein
LDLQQQIRLLSSRVDGLQQRDFTVRRDDVYGVWQLTAPTNPNVASPGVTWTVSSITREDPNLLYKGVDNFINFTLPGRYLIQGHLIMTPDAARQNVEIRIVKNGTVGRMIGHTSASVAASNRIIGTFMVVSTVVADDVLAINTRLHGAAGTLTPVVESGLDVSVLMATYLGEYD